MNRSLTAGVSESGRPIHPIATPGDNLLQLTRGTRARWNKTCPLSATTIQACPSGIARKAATVIVGSEAKSQLITIIRQLLFSASKTEPIQKWFAIEGVVLWERARVRLGYV
ncbi:hypothetical protein BaRGS_00016853 [Batillaria attramentaria]|uniref:Uncharacterized protein n=1 Tax=Batillaria attramentaria TaxID=370345 RepID=A0ABD0KX54_9CAEN